MIRNFITRIFLNQEDPIECSSNKSTENCSQYLLDDIHIYKNFSILNALIKWNKLNGYTG